MNAIARLIVTYFTCTAWTRWMTALGSVLIIAALLALTWFPGVARAELWGFAGVGALFLGSALMPLTFGRLAAGRLGYVLPHGRLKLLTSAWVTTALVALPTPVLTVLAVNGLFADRPRGAAFALSRLDVLLWGNPFAQFIWAQCALVMLLWSWLYIVIWFVTSSRNTAGLTRGLLLLIAIIYFPSKYASDVDLPLLPPLLMLLAFWTLLGLCILLLPRLRSFAASRRMTFMAPALAPSEITASSGREVDLLLGTAKPWLLALVQIPPVLLATAFIRSPGSWLFYLAIFSAAAGAVAGGAALRSRSIWLRAAWSRNELFTHVEKRFWRYNGCAVAVLLLLLVVLGRNADRSGVLLALGAPLLAIGALASTYLGLMMTRGLRWLETTLAIGVMMLLMAGAILTARPDANIQWIIALQLALAACAAIFRTAAKRRWSRLDWMLCRSDSAGLKAAR